MRAMSCCRPFISAPSSLLTEWPPSPHPKMIDKYICIYNKIIYINTVQIEYSLLQIKQILDARDEAVIFFLKLQILKPLLNFHTVLHFLWFAFMNVIIIYSVPVLSWPGPGLAATSLQGRFTRSFTL